MNAYRDALHDFGRAVDRWAVGSSDTHPITGLSGILSATTTAAAVDPDSLRKACERTLATFYQVAPEPTDWGGPRYVVIDEDGGMVTRAAGLEFAVGCLVQSPTLRAMVDELARYAPEPFPTAVQADLDTMLGAVT